MAIISISIVESTLQIVSGIPKTLTLSANIPSTIFYTLDGTEPTTGSSIYIGPIDLPTNLPTVNFKVFATNGVDSSPIITTTYQSTKPPAFQSRSPIISTQSPALLAPFGDNGGFVPEARSGLAPPGVVDSAEVANIPDGYDGTGTGTYANGTDEPLSSYKRIFSTTNSKGESGPGIGTIPGKVKITNNPVQPSTSSKTSDKLFNPKAMVIYQDSRNPPDDPNLVTLNRQYFSLQNPEKDKSGGLLFNSAFDSSAVSGSFLRSHYNPRENTITYYYRDSYTGQWIISVEPYLPKKDGIGALDKIIFSPRQNGIGMVFKWIPFMSRRLI